MSKNQTKFQEVLERGYLEWQLENGAGSKKDFSRYIGIHPTQMSHYFSGRREPTGKNLTKLTLAIGPRVLTALGLIKDPMLKFVLNNFNELSEKQLKEILGEVRTTVDDKELREISEAQASRKHTKL